MAFLDLNGLTRYNNNLNEKLSTKAEVDGAYEGMTVGNAEQLISTTYEEDSVPYNFRTSGGSADIGDREFDELVGGTLAWNQLFPTKTVDFSGTNYTVVSNNDGEFTITVSAEATSTGADNVTNLSSSTFTPNHVYAWLGSDKGISVKLKAYDKGTDTIFKPSSTAYNNITFMFTNLAVGTYKVKPQLFDLTQLFGSTIADYIYSLETSHAGDGVAWFRKLFPKPYYAYNSGELMSVDTSAHKTVGFNAWDEVWEVGTISGADGQNGTANDRIRSKNYIPVLPNTQYYIKGAMDIFYYDAEKTYFKNTTGASNVTVTMDANAHYIRFRTPTSYGTTYNNDICINLSWSGYRNGEYEAYKMRSYPLADITLRGIPKLDADNKLYCDGDTYASDGTVTRRYKVIKFSDISLSYVTYDSTNAVFTLNINNSAYGGRQGYVAHESSNIVCALYETKPVAYNASYATLDKVMWVHTSGSLRIKDSAYTDATTFMTAMANVELLFEIETPTTESVDAFASPQIVDDFGTEEYVDTRTVPIPVGHNTKYTNNLRDKIQRMADSPSGNGDYVLRQTDGENTFVPLVNELPSAPSDDGTYVLKVTVNGSSVSYSWVSE